MTRLDFLPESTGFGGRKTALLLACLLVGASLAAVATPVAGDDTVLLVSTDVSDSQPTTDRNVTVTTSLAVDDDGEKYVVSRVRLFNATEPTDRHQLNSTRPKTSVAPGEERTVNLSVGFDNVGTRKVLVQVDLLSYSGERKRVERVLRVDVREPHPIVGLQFAPTVAGSPTNATVTVANGLDGAIRNVELRLDPERTTLTNREHVFARVAGGDERTVDVGVRGNTTGVEHYDATLSYTYNGTRHNVERTLTASFVEPSNPGRVELNNLRIEETAEGLRVRGTASNPGGSDVTGVTVSVLDGEHVSPAPNNAEFFVGRVAESDFGTFEALATSSHNGSVTVPVRVEYLVDGVPRETVREVRYVAEPDTDPEQQSGGLPLPLLGGSALAVVVVGGVVWRVSRGRN